jgi:hypothetical protein
MLKISMNSYYIGSCQPPLLAGITDVVDNFEDKAGIFFYGKK